MSTDRNASVVFIICGYALLTLVVGRYIAIPLGLHLLWAGVRS